MAPQVLTEVTHDMSVMTEESFGLVVGIMKVASDEEAVRLMNDSAYGLTASIWTADLAAAEAIGGEIQTGTGFMNRADYRSEEHTSELPSLMRNTYAVFCFNKI